MNHVVQYKLPKLPLCFCPNGDAILQERSTELSLYLQLWKTEISSTFLKTSIRTTSKEHMSALIQFLDKSNYEQWINDGFGARFAEFEWQGNKYKVAFYSKKMDLEAFQDWNKEYILII